MTISLRTAVLVVALLNLGYFSIEFAVALNIRSVSLFADSVDFLEDTSVNLLIFFALAWSGKTRARIGMAMAAILLVPALAFLWSLWGKLADPVPPEPFALSVTGLGALVINTGCAVLLARFRSHGGSLTKAAFLSARNDAIAVVARRLGEAADLDACLHALIDQVAAHRQGPGQRDLADVAGGAGGIGPQLAPLSAALGD